MYVRQVGESYGIGSYRHEPLLLDAEQIREHGDGAMPPAEMPFAPDHFDTDASRLFVAAGDGTFSEAAETAGVDDRERGYAAVCADFDNDGDVDVFQAHRGDENAATLWRNDTTGHRYLRVRLVGTSPNTEAVGARIRVTVGEKEFLREIVIGSNYTSQNPTLQVFGLGSASLVDRLVVEWPDGRRTTRTQIEADQTLVLTHPDL